MSIRRRQDAPRIEHRAFSNRAPIFLAGDPECWQGFVEEQIDKRRLWKGLERFVNCDDSPRDIKALAMAFPDICVFPVYVEAARELFLYYREALRHVWGRSAMKSTRRDDADFLLGLPGSGGHDPSSFLRAERIFRAACPPVAYLHRAAYLKTDWESGNFIYTTTNNFQRAFYLLFRESWRARVCPICYIYFIAEKPRQKFCSPSCSIRSRLQSNLDWYYREGAERRRRIARKRKRRKP